MMLDQCRRDFSALINRINVQDAFEKADYKDRYGCITLEVVDSFVSLGLSLNFESPVTFSSTA